MDKLEIYSYKVSCYFKWYDPDDTRLYYPQYGFDLRTPIRIRRSGYKNILYEYYKYGRWHKIENSIYDEHLKSIDSKFWQLVEKNKLHKKLERAIRTDKLNRILIEKTKI